MNTTLHIEGLRKHIHDDLTSSCSERKKIFLLYSFFDELLKTGYVVQQAYFPEFIDIYLDVLGNYHPFGINPRYTEALTEQLTIISGKEFLEEYKQRINGIITALRKDLNKLNRVLTGSDFTGQDVSKPFFPVIEEDNSGRKQYVCDLESLTISVTKAKYKDDFIIIPRETELESRIEKQIHISWSFALEYTSKFIRKFSPHHKVIIHFDKMLGVYTGNSMGIALTLGFIDAILKEYNSSTIVSINQMSAFTGGVDENGLIVKLPDEITEVKAECIFFSPVRTFVLHRDNEQIAIRKIEELKRSYPGKSAEVVGVSTLQDLLNRRNLVDIRKQKFSTRVTRFIRQNPISLFLLLFIISFFLVYSSVIWDRNPDNYTFNGNIISINNKLGQSLWTKRMIFSKDSYEGDYNFTRCCRITDTDNDGINEVILTLEEADKKTSENSFGRVVCYNSRAEELWAYNFRDPVSTGSINHSLNYLSYLVDTLTVNNQKCLFLIARNIPLYPNAVYKLDVRTGRRVDSLNTLWHAGSISVIIGDFNEDGKTELAAAGVNNSFERAVFFTIDIENISGTQMPATEYYSLINNGISLERARFNKYFIFPQTDFSYYNNQRYNFAMNVNFYKNSKEFEVIVAETIGYALVYYFKKDLQLKMVDCSDTFSFERDKQVRGGKLFPPLTNTSAFFHNIREHIKILEPGDNLPEITPYPIP
jgi:hypothetical protein